MTTTDEIMAMIISYGSTCMAYADGLENATDLDNAKVPIKSAIEALVAERDAKKVTTHRLVPEHMVIDSESLRFLHGISQPDDEGNYSEILLSVGDGHDGHGLYVSLSEYPEEGSEIICRFIAISQEST